MVNPTFTSWNDGASQRHSELGGVLRLHIASKRHNMVNPTFTSWNDGASRRHSELGGVLRLHIDSRVG